MIVLGPFTEYKLYNGDVTLRYYSDPIHEYYRVDGEKLIHQDGVTTCCHIIDKSAALVPWSAKVMYEKLMRTLPVQEANDGTKMLEPMSLEEFENIAAAAKSAHKDKLDEAGDIGHVAHEWLEHYIKVRLGIVSDSFLEYPNNEMSTSCVKAALDWMKKHNVRWISTECKICSRKHNYSGTADGTAWTDSCDDPKCCPKPFKNHRSLIDWKSSNYLYIEYLYQTAAYQQAIEEETGVKFDDRWIIKLGKKDGKVEKWHLLPEDYEADWKGFELCLYLYRQHNGIEERMKQRKDAAKDEQKRQKATEKAVDKENKRIAREEKKAAKVKKAIDKKSKA